MPESLFFDIKLNSVDLHFIKKENFAPVLSCEFCEICKSTFFAEYHCTTASIAVKGELANETVNYNTKTKA